jgi:hypothetical protein
VPGRHLAKGWELAIGTSRTTQISRSSRELRSAGAMFWVAYRASITPQQGNSKPVGLPRSFDHKEVLDGAMHVFWKKDYEGASLDQLTKAMGIKPGSLYAAFGSEEQLFCKSLERFRTQPFRSNFSPIQECGCTVCFRVSDTRCGTCVILPAFLQSRCSPS